MAKQESRKCFYLEIKTNKKKPKTKKPLSQITRENKNVKSLENKMKTLIS